MGMILSIQNAAIDESRYPREHQYKIILTIFSHLKDAPAMSKVLLFCELDE